MQLLHSLLSVALFSASCALGADMGPRDPITGVPFVPINPGPTNRSLSPITAAIRLIAFTAPTLKDHKYIPNNNKDQVYGYSVFAAVQSMQFGTRISDTNIGHLAGLAIESDPTKFKRGKTFDPIDIYFEFLRVLDSTMKQVKLDKDSLQLKLKTSQNCTRCGAKKETENGTTQTITQTMPDLKFQLSSENCSDAVCMEESCKLAMQFAKALPRHVKTRDYYEGEPQLAHILMPRDGTTRFGVKPRLFFNDTNYRLLAVLYENTASADRYGVIMVGDGDFLTVQNSTNMTISTFSNELYSPDTSTVRPLLLVYVYESKTPTIPAAAPATTVSPAALSTSLTASVLTAKQHMPIQNLPHWPEFEFMRPGLVLLAFLFYKDLPNGTQKDHLLCVLWSLIRRAPVSKDNMSGVYDLLAKDKNLKEMASKPELLLPALFNMLPPQYRESRSCHFSKVEKNECTTCGVSLPGKTSTSYFYNVNVESLDGVTKACELPALLSAKPKTAPPPQVEGFCPSCNSKSDQTVTETLTEVPRKLLFINLQRKTNAFSAKDPEYIRLAVPSKAIVTDFEKYSELIAFVEQIDEVTFATWVKLGEDRWVRVTKDTMKTANPTKELTGEPQFDGPRILVYRN